MKEANENGIRLAEAHTQSANVATEIINLQDSVAKQLSEERTRLDRERAETLATARFAHENQLKRAKEDLQSEFNAHAAGRKQLYNEMDQKDHIQFIKTQAAALGLAEYEELTAPVPKRARNVRVDCDGKQSWSASVISLRKRGRSASPPKLTPKSVPIPLCEPSYASQSMDEDTTPKGSPATMAARIPEPTTPALAGIVSDSQVDRSSDGQEIPDVHTTFPPACLYRGRGDLYLYADVQRHYQDPPNDHDAY